MAANYVGPGWYWVENVDKPLYCEMDKDGMVWASNMGLRFNIGGMPINITHIPRPAQRPIVDWSEMPAWAKWVAMDEDGNWHFFECEPQQYSREWFGQYYNFPKAYWPTYTGDWKNSLVERPE